jgi:acyl-homoserine lactone acylase PvdQ
MLIGMFSDQEDRIKIPRCEWVVECLDAKHHVAVIQVGNFPDGSNRERHDGGWNKAMNPTTRSVWILCSRDNNDGAMVV